MWQDSYTKRVPHLFFGVFKYDFQFFCCPRFLLGTLEMGLSHSTAFGKVSVQIKAVTKLLANIGCKPLTIIITYTARHTKLWANNKTASHPRLQFSRGEHSFKAQIGSAICSITSYGAGSPHWLSIVRRKHFWGDTHGGLDLCRLIIIAWLES